MNTIKKPIKWNAEYLVCECGGDMQFVFVVRKESRTIHLHACNTCGRAEESEVKYPNPVWEEV